MQKVKVCLVEDDRASMYLAKVVIASVSKEVEVIGFKDGAPAYDFILNNLSDTQALPDIILLDLNMPRMDGWKFLEAYESIKDKIDKNISIYILSSSISDKDMVRAKDNALVKDYIIKPMEESRFIQILQSIEG
jgi:CheY-like chemotaxis protein